MLYDYDARDDHDYIAGCDLDDLRSAFKHLSMHTDMECKHINRDEMEYAIKLMGSILNVYIEKREYDHE